MERKIRYLSDLHLEYSGYQPDHLPSLGEDLVVLAGDIGSGIEGIRWAKEAFRDRKVVYVLGNHEFFGYDFVDLVDHARSHAAGSNVSVLECDSIEIDGLQVLGCSLWTDFKLFGTDRQSEVMDYALEYMADYEEIRRPHGGSVIPKNTLQRCESSYAWLKQSLSASTMPTLVITHHAPSIATVSPRHVGQISNAAYHSHFDALIAPPCVGWIHGHTHHSMQTQVNGIPLVTNQRGYPREDLGGFSWDRMIEVELKVKP